MQTLHIALSQTKKHKCTCFPLAIGVQTESSGSCRWCEVPQLWYVALFSTNKMTKILKPVYHRFTPVANKPEPLQHSTFCDYCTHSFLQHSCVLSLLVLQTCADPHSPVHMQLDSHFTLAIHYFDLIP